MSDKTVASDETVVRFLPDDPQAKTPVALAVFWTESQHRVDHALAAPGSVPGHDVG